VEAGPWWLSGHRLRGVRFQGHSCSGMPQQLLNDLTHPHH
jgi:hypothetical protein